MDYLKVYVFELKEMLDALIDSVAGREGVQEMACEMAQAGCYGAVEKLRMTEGWYTDEEKREILEKTLRSLAPTFFLLDATPEIKDTQDISIQKKYEACMCLLNEINTLAITRGFSFQALGVHFAHPLVEDMGNNMEQIAKLLEITHKQIIIETDKTDEIKHQLGECLIHIDNALKGLDNFLVNQNAADALEIKQRLVNQLVGELEVLHPKELMKMVKELEDVTFGEGAIKTLVEIAKEMSEVGNILVKHASSEEKETLKVLFDYKETLKKKEVPDLVTQLRHDMMFVSAKMTDAVQYNPNPHIKDEWIKAARGLEEGAGNYQRVEEGDDKRTREWVVKSPTEILPLVNIALDTMTSDETRLFTGEPPLLKKLRYIHDQLDKVAREER